MRSDYPLSRYHDRLVTEHYHHGGLFHRRRDYRQGVILEQNQDPDILPGAGLSFPAGKPTDNAFIEAFNSRFRQECLNAHRFLSREDTKEKIEVWRGYYNGERPHSILDYRSPKEHQAFLQKAGEIALQKG